MENNFESPYAPIVFDPKNNDEYVDLGQIMKGMETYRDHTYGTTEHVQNGDNQYGNPHQAQEGTETDPDHIYGTSEHDLDNNNDYGNPHQAQRGMEDKHAPERGGQAEPSQVAASGHENETISASSEDIKKFDSRVDHFRIQCFLNLVENIPLGDDTAREETLKRRLFTILDPYIDTGYLIRVSNVAHVSSRQIVLDYFQDQELRVQISRKRCIIKRKPRMCYVAKMSNGHQHFEVIRERRTWLKLTTHLSHCPIRISSIELVNMNGRIKYPIFRSCRKAEADLFNKITRLVLINTRWEDKKVMRLMESANSLVDLSVHGNRRVDLASIPPHVKSRLQRVSLGECRLPQAGILALTEFGNLRDLKLNEITYVEHLKGFETRFPRYRRNWESMLYLPSEFAQLRNLEKLHISGGFIVGDCYALGKLPKLECLHLHLLPGPVPLQFRVHGLNAGVRSLTLKGNVDLEILGADLELGWLNADLQCIFNVRNHLILGPTSFFVELQFFPHSPSIKDWAHILEVSRPTFYGIRKSQLEDLLNLPCKWERVALLSPFDLSPNDLVFFGHENSIWKLKVLEKGDRGGVQSATLTKKPQAPARANNRAE